MRKLEPAAQRVQDALRARGLGSEVRHMRQTTRTAAEAAKACGCAIGQIVKSLVFRGAQSGKPYLLLVSGANRVNEKAAGERIGEPLRRPDAQYVRDVTGFAIGGIPPLGHDTTARDIPGSDAARLRRGVGGGRHTRRRIPYRPGATRGSHRRYRHRRRLSRTY